MTDRVPPLRDKQPADRWYVVFAEVWSEPLDGWVQVKTTHLRPGDAPIAVRQEVAREERVPLREVRIRFREDEYDERSDA
jgi:hypothetical protein